MSATVEIETAQGARVAVEADAVGETWAATRVYGRGARTLKWTITHVPSGRGISLASGARVYMANLARELETRFPGLDIGERAKLIELHTYLRGRGF